MKLKHFVLPEKVEIESETATDSYAKYTITPLEKGWGHTIGNALRRALLSSVQGAAISQVRIDNVMHEFTTIPDVLEDVPEIILNLKRIRILTNHPRRVAALEGFDIEIVEQVPVKFAAPKAHP